MKFCLGLAAAIAVSSAAVAEPVCVDCTSPDKIYRCYVMNAQGQPASLPDMFCLRRIADDHGHASCSAIRTQACEGEPKTYIADDANAPPFGRPMAKRSNQAEEKPATLVGVTKDAVQSSGAAVKKTGEKIGEAGQAVGDAVKTTGQAVGNAAKKTWRCIGSGLKEC
jgi:hypothetical protein